MLERTHIGIESHKTHVWFDSEGDIVKSVRGREFMHLKAKRGQNRHVAESIQDFKTYIRMNN